MPRPTKSNPHAPIPAREGRFDHLLSVALGINQLRDADALHTFLIDAAAKLCAATRVLLVLETPAGLQIAGAKLPRGETPAVRQQ